MKRQPIESSSIRTAGYDPVLQELEIEFSSTAVYRYVGVPPEVWKAFLATDSKGSYFVARIRDRFKFECVYRPSRKEKTNADSETKTNEAQGQTRRTVAAKGRKEEKARIS